MGVTLKGILKLLGGYAQKWLRPFRSYGTQVHLINDLMNQAEIGRMIFAL